MLQNIDTYAPSFVDVHVIYPPLAVRANPTEIDPDSPSSERNPWCREAARCEHATPVLTPSLNMDLRIVMGKHYLNIESSPLVHTTLRAW